MPAGRTGFIDGLSSGVDGPVNNLLVFCPMGDHAPAELCGFEYSSSVYTRESVRRSRLSGGMAKAEASKYHPKITQNNLQSHIFAVPYSSPRLYHNVLSNSGWSRGGNSAKNPLGFMSLSQPQLRTRDRSRSEAAYQQTACVDTDSSVVPGIVSGCGSARYVDFG